MPLEARRLLRLTSRTLCLAAIPVVVFAFWDYSFSPLAIKELLTESTGLLAFLCWWVGRAPRLEKARGQRLPEAGGADGRRRNPRGLPNPLGTPLLCLCLWALVSILWTGPKQLALHHWSTLAGLLLFLPPLFEFGASPIFRKTLRNAILVVGTLLLVLAAFQMNGISLGELLRTGGGNSRTRVSLTIGHNNGVAPIVLLTSFLALGAVAETRNRVFRAALVLTCLASWALILFCLLTRSTILGLLFGTLLLVLVNIYHLRRKVALQRTTRANRWPQIALGTALAAILLLVVLGGTFTMKGGAIEGTYNPNLARNIADRLRTLNPKFLMVDSRARLWTIGAYMMKHHPLLGLGFSSAKYDYPFYQAVFFEYHPDFPAGSTSSHTERLHNDYLQWAAECGAMGLLLLLWCLLVFSKTILRWLRRATAVSSRRWFMQSTVLTACVAPLMDAFFSFPAHIAPIAIYLPALVVLWFGETFPSQPLRFSSLFPAPSRSGLRAACAVGMWAVLTFPLGANEDRQPWLTRTGVWVPLDSQVYGRYWQGRILAAKTDFTRFLARESPRLASAEDLPPEEVKDALRTIRQVRQLYLKYPPIVPFAGEAIFGAAQCLDTLDEFYASGNVGQGLAGAVRKNPKDEDLRNLVVSERSESVEFITLAKELYEKSQQNYRYHELFRRLGLACLKLSRRHGIPDSLRGELVSSARKDLSVARRIWYTDGGLFLELDLALRMGDKEQADHLVDILLKRSPAFLEAEGLPLMAERGITRHPKTGRKTLDPTIQEFLRLLLPRLTPSHADMLRSVLTLLDGGNAADLTREYALTALRLLPKKDRAFLVYRMLGGRHELGDLAEEMRLYRTLIEEEGSMTLEERVLYLSDLQRFSPPTTDLSEWRSEIEALWRYPDQVFPIAVGHQCLAQEAMESRDWVSAWRHLVEADLHTPVSGRGRVTERRYSALETALWGTAWPFLFE